MEVSMLKNVAKIVSKARIEHGYTQKELADMLNINVNTIQKIEYAKGSINSSISIS